jgi:hypothetical protein
LTGNTIAGFISTVFQGQSLRRMTFDTEEEAIEAAEAITQEYQAKTDEP